MNRRIVTAGVAAALCALAACCGYRTVSFERKLAQAGPVPLEEKAPGEEGAAAEKRAVRFTAVRYLALMRSASPVAVINDRAVEYAVQSRYGEAEVLFREALAEQPSSAAASNNLGVLCELAGRRSEAFRLYSAACLREPGNAVFRKNFIGFADSTPGRR